MPVLPLVESRRIFPGFSLPECRASRMMLAAARSFTDPPGLHHSALPRSSTPGRARLTRSRRSSGVFPTRSKAYWPRRGASAADFSCAFWVARTLDEIEAMAGQKYCDYSNVPDSAKKRYLLPAFRFKDMVYRSRQVLQDELFARWCI